MRITVGQTMALILKFRNIAFATLFIVSITSSQSWGDVMKQGLQIFNEKAGCAACHVLKHAGSKGNIGPNLDMSKDSKNVAYVKDMVQNGLGVMPAFGEDGILTPEEVDIVSKYVANVAGKQIYKVMLEILNMGGYAVFVWSAYFIALCLTFFLYQRSVKQLKLAEKQAKELGLVADKVEEIAVQKYSA